MKHKKIKKNLVPWLEGKLSEKQRKWIDLHLQECSDCLEYYQKMQQILEKPDLSSLSYLTADPFLLTRIQNGEIRSISDPADMPLFDGLRWSFVTILIFVGISLGAFMGYLVMQPEYRDDSSLVTEYYQAFNQGGADFELEKVINVENGEEK